MALSATFTANFSSFYDAVDKAEAKLKDFGTGADKVGTRLNTLANQFSGQKIVQEATLMAKAVEEIGGVTKLTDKELARLGSTASEAVEKMQKLGMDVPKNLQEIADKTKDANKSTTDWTGSLVKMAGALGIAFSLGAIKSFIGSVFDAAGAIKDLSDQWGVSTKFAQQWKAAAEASGIEAEQLGKSIQFVTEKLSESSPEYAALLKNIGLSSEALRKMPLEDAYKEVVRAIAGVEDETLQLDIAIGLLGPSAKKVIGGIRDGLYDAADAQAFMADETIKRLDEAQDAWKKFGDRVVIISGEMLVGVMDDTKRMTSSWQNFFRYLAAAAGGMGEVDRLIQQDKALEKLNATMKGVVTTTESYTVAGKQMTSGLQTTAQVLEEQRKKEEALKKAQQDRTKAQEDAKRKEDEYIQSLRKHNDALLDVVNTFEGKGLIQKANLYLEALKDSIPVQQMTRAQQENINAVMLAAIQVYDAAGEEAPQAMYDMWAATMKLDQATVKYTTDLEDMSAGIQKLITDKVPFVGTMTYLGEAPKAIKATKTQLEILSDEFQKLGTASGGTLGAFLGGIGQMIVLLEAAEASTKQLGKDNQQLGGSFGALSVLLNENATDAQRWGAAVQAATALAAGGMDVWTMSANQGSQAMNTLGGAAAGAKVGASFGAYGMLIGAATGATIGFVRSVDDGRDALEQFANRSGGWDSLHRQMSALGADGERMWVQLTQGIKKGDLAGATREILLVQQALSDLAAKAQWDFDQAAKAAEKSFKDAADAAKRAADEQLQVQEDLREAIKQYGFTIEELGPKWRQQELDAGAQKLLRQYDLLVGSGIDVITVQTRMSESINTYLHDALKTGAEIPESWKPILESMAQAGLLTDEAGNKLTDLSQVKWSETLGDKFDNLADKLQKILNKILGIPDVIKTVNGQIGDGIVVPVTLQNSIGGGGTASPAPVGPTFGGAQAAGGDYLVTRPTLFLAGEAGAERATFRPMGGGGGGVNVGGVSINISASTVDDDWLRRGGARRIADAVAAHLGRSLGMAPV